MYITYLFSVDNLVSFLKFCGKVLRLIKINRFILDLNIFKKNKKTLNICLEFLVEVRRFELLTPCVQGRCSPN